jgi:hypothetical protein
VSSIGQAVFGAVGLVAGFAVGSPMMGLSIGLMIGGLLFPPTAEDDSAKPTPGTLQVQTSTYGLTIPVVYGTRRIAGNLIWYGDFTPVEHVEQSQQGGKGGGGGSSQTNTWYTYTCGFAVGLCMGTAQVLRIWQGSTLIYGTGVAAGAYSGTITIYDGTQTTPDPYITQFVTRSPVYKGLCYVVFQDFDLGQNTSLPNFTMEICNSDTAPVLQYVSQFTNAGIHSGSVDGQENVATDGTYIYVVRNNNPDYATTDAIYKIDPTTMALVGAPLQLANASGIYYDNGYLYCTGKIHYIDAQWRWLKIDPSNMTIVSYSADIYTLIGSASLNFYKWIVKDDIIYACIYHTGSAVVIMHTISTLTWTQGASYYFPSGITICFGVFAYGDYLYVSMSSGATYLTIARMYQLDLVSMTLVGYVNYNRAYNSSIGSPMFVSDNLLWVGGTSNSVNRFVLDPVTWYDVNTVVVNAGMPLSQMADIDTVYTSVLWQNSSNSQIYLIKKSTMAEVTSYSLTNWYPLGLITLNGYVYYFTFHSEIGYTKSLRVDRIRAQQVQTDCLPTFISKDILLNTFYGEGLSASLYDNTAAATTDDYCITNDLLVSMVFDRQVSVLDALQQVLQHHNGYIKYANGIISHEQLKVETAVTATISNYSVAGIIQPEGRDTYPIYMTKKGGRDYTNKLVINYTNRASDYVVGTVIADDMVDINNYGTLENAVNLNGFCTYERAYKMGYLLLEKSLLSPEAIKFKLGPSQLPLQPGDVIQVTDVNMDISNYKVRISTISESDGYVVDVEGLQEYDSLYSTVSLDATINVPDGLPDLYEAALNTTHLMAVEIPPCYVGEDIRVGVSFSKPNQLSWCGASLYEANNSGGPYTLKKTTSYSGVGGIVNAVGITTTDTRYIDITLDTDFTLESALDFDSFMQKNTENLMVVRTSTGDKFLRFQNVALLSANKWRLSGLLYDTIEFPVLNTYGSVAALNVVSMYKNLPFNTKFDMSDTHKPAYFKIPSFNFRGVEQDLSIASATSVTVTDKAMTPLAPDNILINNIIGLDSNYSANVSSGDVSITWSSKNRFNDGVYNYTRSDSVQDDYDFVTFILEVYKSGAVIRTVTQTAKTFRYTSAMQATDGVSGSIIFKLYEQGLTETSLANTFTITLV